MATIREYFDTDPRALAIHVDWNFSSSDGALLSQITAKIAYDFEANAKYWYFYVPAIPNLSECLSALFRSPEFSACRLGPEGDGVYVAVGHADYPVNQTTETLQFTKRVHLYLDFDITAENRTSLVAEALGRGTTFPCATANMRESDQKVKS